MLKKMPKSLLAVCTIMGISLLTCGFTYAKTNTDLLQFVGENNAEITLLTDRQKLIQSNRDTINEYDGKNLEVGQVIVSNGVEEIVFAIGTDGSYITIPVSK